nr:type II toxin-antitoxin system HicB family antitoxin [uncultured Mediterraneibacter sp.]
MKNIMEYKGYLGSVEFSEEDELFFGRVLGIRSLISYEADNAKELISDFHNSVDEYLNMCEEEGKEPDKAYKGSFNIRISPQLHKQLVICAMDHNTTLNGYIQEVLEKAVM